MLERILSGSKVMEKSLDVALLRNDAISHNIANVDTPGYKRKTVSFEEQLRNAISENSVRGARTDPRHIPVGSKNVDDLEIRVAEDKKPLDMRLDGNNVDIESEMAQMAKNTIKYNVLSDRISGYFRKMKSVISEGRR